MQRTACCDAPAPRDCPAPPQSLSRPATACSWLTVLPDPLRTPLHRPAAPAAPAASPCRPPSAPLGRSNPLVGRHAAPDRHCASTCIHFGLRRRHINDSSKPDNGRRASCLNRRQSRSVRLSVTRPLLGSQRAFVSRHRSCGARRVRPHLVCVIYQERRFAYCSIARREVLHARTSVSVTAVGRCKVVSCAGKGRTSTSVRTVVASLLRVCSSGPTEKSRTACCDMMGDCVAADLTASKKFFFFF